MPTPTGLWERAHDTPTCFHGATRADADFIAKNFAAADMHALRMAKALLPGPPFFIDIFDARMTRCLADAAQLGGADTRYAVFSRKAQF